MPSPPGCQPPALPTRGHRAPSGTRGFRNMSVKAGPALLQLAGPSFPESVRDPGTRWGVLCEAAGAQAQASSSWCKAFSHAASGDCRTGTGGPGHSVQTRLGSSLKPLLPVGPTLSSRMCPRNETRPLSWAPSAPPHSPQTVLELMLLHPIKKLSLGPVCLFSLKLPLNEALRT